ncbi:MAG: V-type ATP synthase subunit D [Spirochaetaceae bacterium]|jgi:V/A-type H+-transporting ATPase subunit D|nr:V-type ATP synthase subunit D [Spirochaetaceae bacterium]
MPSLNVAPTKSNLLAMGEELDIARQGYDLLEQKREVLVMELMRMVEKVKLLERDIEKRIDTAYAALTSMLMMAGGDRVERISRGVHYDFRIVEKRVVIAGMRFSSLEARLPKPGLFYSFMETFADVDKVAVEFFKLLELLTDMAAIRSIVWRLALEVKKTQRRVNALDKIVIPQTRDTKAYIEGVLEERERENIFVLKALKARNKEVQR